MDESLIVGMLLGTVGALCLNVGKGIQKWKVHVLGHGREMFSSEHRRDFSVWLVGALMTATATVWFAAALKMTDKTSLVSSLNGVGLIGLVIFAALVLKERLGLREILGAGLVVAGTTLMGYFDQPLPTGQAYSLTRFILSGVVVFALFTPLIAFSLITKKLHGFSFGAVVGSLIGIAMIMGDMGLVKSGQSILGMLSNPYPYLALLLGAIALALTQFAFWRSTAMIVVPTINSFIVFVPVIIEYITFGTVLRSVQYLAILVIVAGVILLTTSPETEALSELPADS